MRFLRGVLIAALGLSAACAPGTLVLGDGAVIDTRVTPSDASADRAGVIGIDASRDAGDLGDVGTTDVPEATTHDVIVVDVAADAGTLSPQVCPPPGALDCSRAPALATRTSA